VWLVLKPHTKDKDLIHLSTAPLLLTKDIHITVTFLATFTQWQLNSNPHIK
jgi:hypothetical protein